MEITTKSRMYHISALTIGLLIDLKERISSIVQRRDGRAQPRIEEPDEENRGYEGILPGREGTPDTGAEPDGQLPSDIAHPDTAVPDDAETQRTYTGETEEALPSDITGGEGDLWQEELDPSTEEDIPLRPSEVEIPDEIHYDQEEDLRVISPEQDSEETAFERLEEDPDLDNPDEFDSDTFPDEGNKGTPL
jgi:hypothetical protein